MMVYRKLCHFRLALITTLAGGASAVDALPAQGVDYAGAADTSIDARELPVGRLVNGERALQFDVRGTSYWCPLDAPRCVVVDSAQS
jgi:hypothetical protein